MNKKITVLLGFPHIWVTVIIAVLTIISFIASLWLNSINSFWSSLCANIFAGLLTGLIILLVSSTKSMYTADLLSKKNMLEDIKELTIKYRIAYKDLITMNLTQFIRDNGEEGLFNCLYDLDVIANDVNTTILHFQHNEALPFDPQKYCRKYLSYNEQDMQEIFLELHYAVLKTDGRSPSKKEIIEQFTKVNNEINKLHNLTNSLIKEINLRLKLLNHVL